jgi:hypothetical protein
MLTKLVVRVILTNRFLTLLLVYAICFLDIIRHRQCECLTGDWLER